MRRAWLGVVIGLACRVPDTLGLPCLSDAHCDAGQHCGGDGTCEAGAGTSEGTTLPVTSESSATSITTTLGTSSTTSEPTTSSATTSVDTSSSSTTEPGCGAAIGTCDAVDVLFVVDNSGSMDDEFAQFVPALSNFADLLGEVTDGICSYHIGVTTTETAPDFQTPECQVRGALSKSGSLLGGDSCFGDDTHPPYVTEEDSLSVLGCLFAVGTAYDPDEKTLDTAIAAISPELGMPGACNEGFIREDAALVIVLITDEDDDDDSSDPEEAPERTGSSGDPTEWFARIGAVKPPASTGVLGLLATDDMVCDPWLPAPDNDDGTGAEIAIRILTFMQHYTGVGLGDHIYAGDICLPTDELFMQIGHINAVVQSVCADHEAR